MNLVETDQLLTVIQNLDKRKIDDATVLLWQQILGDLDYADCVRAAINHFRESTDYLLPAHIVAGARTIERERIREENQRRALEAAPETDPRPLADRSQEIRDFVARVRSTLPPGDPASLKRGHGYWDKVQADWKRQQQAQPNPHYDPTALGRLAEEQP